MSTTSSSSPHIHDQRGYTRLLESTDGLLYAGDVVARELVDGQVAHVAPEDAVFHVIDVHFAAREREG